MATWNIFEEDLTPTFVALAKKHQPKGAAEPLYDGNKPYMFEPSLSFDGKVEELFKSDALFKKKLKDARDTLGEPIRKRMIEVIEHYVKECAKGWKPDSDPMSAYENPKSFETMAASIEKAVNQCAHLIQEKVREVGDAYLLQRHEGKLAVKKYEKKMLKGVLRTTVAVGGLAGAIASAVGTFGATSGGAVVAAYHVLLEIKDCATTYKKWHTDVDTFLRKLESHIAELDEKFRKADKSGEYSKGKINFSELKAKAANVFTATVPKSIKSVKEDTGHLEAHVKMGYLELSKAGQVIRKMKTSSKACLAENAQAREQLKAQAKLLPEPLVTATLKKLDASDAQFNAFLDSMIPDMLAGLETEEKRLKTIEEDQIPSYKKWAEDLDKERNEFVKKSSVFMQVGKAGLALASCDFGAMAEGGLDLLEGALELAKDAGESIVEIAAEQKKKKK